MNNDSKRARASKSKANESFNYGRGNPGSRSIDKAGKREPLENHISRKYR